MKIANKELSQYDLKSVKLPYLSGFFLKLMAYLLKSPVKNLLID